MPDPAAGSRPGWINRTIFGIGLASFCSDVGHEMATAAMPMLLASIGAGSAALGLIEGLADGFSSLAKLIAGLYTDRMKRRKPIAVAGYSVTAASMASFALATSWWHVLLGRTAGWIGRGARGPARKVLLAEATTPESYGRAFGLERAMDSAGALVGPLLAFFSVSALGLRRTFALTLIPGLCAAAAIALLVREKEHRPKPTTGFWSASVGLPPRFIRFLSGVGIAGIGDFSNALLILWAGQAWSPLYGPVKAAALSMLFYAGYNAVYTASCYCSGALADALPKKSVLAGGYALAVIPATALLLPGASLAKFAAVFGFSGLYMGVWETVESAAAAEILPQECRGFGFGMLSTVNGLGDLVSSAVVGGLWALHPAAAMGFVIATSAAGAALIAWTPV